MHHQVFSPTEHTCFTRSVIKLWLFYYHWQHNLPELLLKQTPHTRNTTRIYFPHYHRCHLHSCACSPLQHLTKNNLYSQDVACSCNSHNNNNNSSNQHEAPNNNDHTCVCLRYPLHWSPYSVVKGGILKKMVCWWWPIQKNARFHSYQARLTT